MRWPKFMMLVCVLFRCHFDPSTEHLPPGLPKPQATGIELDALAEDRLEPVSAGGVVSAEEFFMSHPVPPRDCPGFVSNEAQWLFHVQRPLQELRFSIEPGANSADLSLIVDGPGGFHCRGKVGRDTIAVRFAPPSAGTYRVWIAHEPGRLARIFGGRGLWTQATLRIHAR